MSAEPAQFADLPEMHPPSGDATEWTIDQDWTSPPLDGRAITIRAGFITDGASIPQAAWSIIGAPMSVPLLGPALCHDALYAAELVADHATADWLFLRYMQLAGIGWFRRNLVWSAVRLFGWSVWRAHTPASVAAARKFCSITAPPSANEDVHR